MNIIKVKPKKKPLSILKKSLNHVIKSSTAESLKIKNV